MRYSTSQKTAFAFVFGITLGSVGLSGATDGVEAGDSNWREESADFIRQYYPHWEEITEEDEANHIAFTVTLEELEVESDGLDFAGSRDLVRDTVLILSPEARERFLMSKHLDAVDYNILNRWSLPLLGSMSAEERALEKERYDRFVALQERNAQVIDFVELQNGAMASQMRAELADASPNYRPDSDRYGY